MKCANRHRSSHSQVAVGLIVVAAGVLFLLHNLDIIRFGEVLSFWPVMLIVFGLIKLADSSMPEGRLVGACLLGGGVLLTLRNAGVFDFSWRIIWPSLVIGAGVLVVYRALTARRLTNPKDGPQISEDVIEATAILGGFERRLTTPQFAGGDISVIMGGCSIDLRACSLQGEAVINVFAVMGGITLKCPPDWTVVLHGTPIMGGFEEKTVRPPDGSKRLVVKGYAIMGGVDVRN